MKYMIGLQKILITMCCLSACCLWMSCNKDEETEKAPEPALSGVSVTVMTYNIYGARPAFGLPPADLKKIAAVIKKYKPDLVALQEVEVYTERSGKDVHQADSLGKLTGMHSFFAMAQPSDGGQFGDAVLSRFPFVETKAYNMNASPELGGQRRAFALVKVNVEDKDLYFASTHLDHLSNEANRLYQAEALRTIVGEINGTLIVGGDFNAVPSSQTIAIIKQYLTIGTSTFSPTFPSNAPTRTIDYIMFKPSSAFYVQNYQVIQESDVSDHCAVFSIMRIK